MSKLLITGGNGFIGSHVVEFFCNKGIKPTCLVRKTSDLSYLKDLPIDIIYGDITELKSLINTFSGFDSVIHIAAYVHDWGSYELFYNTNVLGTLNVLQACCENKITDIIITGSISSYGEGNSKTIIDENYPDNAHYPYFADKIFPCRFNYYRDTKAIAKREAIAYARTHNLNLTILEPVWVFGEKELNAGFFEYLKAVQMGIPFFPGSKKNKFHVVYARDLALSYWLAFQKRLIGINCFIIGNNEIDQMDKIYSLFCKSAGLKKPQNLPKFITYPIGFLFELIYTILRIKTPPILTRGRVNMFYDNIEYSTRKAKDVLGFTNAYSLEEAIQKTFKWYKDNNWLGVMRP